jgi:c-di-AMP phosphodiesterase-like protein
MATLIVFNIILIILLIFVLFYICINKKDDKKNIQIKNEYDENKKSNHKQNEKNNLENIFIGRVVTDDEYKQIMSERRRSDISILLEDVKHEYEYLKKLNNESEGNSER